MASKKKKSELPLDYGICHLACVPIRKRPEDPSEMVSQLLFGETLEILQRKNKSWIKIKCQYDGYEGWIDPKQITFLTEPEFLSCNKEVAIALDLSSGVSIQDRSYPILIGSSLPEYDGMSFKIKKSKCIYNGQAIMTTDRTPSVDLLIRIAKKYMNSPYLWGGRSPFGIDCSGFTQVVFKLMGVPLPRDASDQVHHGSLVDFVELSREGDLAFFENKEGRIHHVGIMYGERQIIHASGKVRIDTLDHEGIYNKEIRKYTHRLKYVKRFFE